MPGAQQAQHDTGTYAAACCVVCAGLHKVQCEPAELERGVALAHDLVGRGATWHTVTAIASEQQTQCDTAANHM